MIENPKVTIEKIVFNDGTSIKLNDDDIVLFVGANNVGKSRTLKDIRDDLNDVKNKKIIINEIEYNTNFDKDIILLNYFENNFEKNRNEEYYVNNYNNGFYFREDELIKPIHDIKKYLKLFYTFLSTENRLKCSEILNYNMRNFDNNTLNTINRLCKRDDLLIKLNKYLFDGFKSGVCVYDDLETGQTNRMYKIGNKNEIDDILKSVRSEANKKLEKLLNLNDQGDGIRSAFAVVSSLIVNDCFLFLIDEPETFLHPPQSKLLGNYITRLSEGKQCFISTHSIDFIKGILEKKPSRVKIIKIDRDGNTNSIKSLENEEIIKISNDKNLKYTNILDGLFYDQVVLCEDESDCKFYSAILEFLDGEIYQNTLFCATGGKHQFKIIAPLLESLSIKYKIIADLDLINDTDSLDQLLKSINRRDENIIKNHNNFINLYEKNSKVTIDNKKDITNKINQLLNDDTGDYFLNKNTIDSIKHILKNASVLGTLKEYGVSSINNHNCYKFYEIVRDYLFSNNIYILEKGEIEKLVPGVEGHGIGWVENVFKTYNDFNNEIYSDSKSFIKKVFNITE